VIVLWSCVCVRACVRVCSCVWLYCVVRCAWDVLLLLCLVSVNAVRDLCVCVLRLCACCKLAVVFLRVCFGLNCGVVCVNVWLRFRVCACMYVTVALCLAYCMCGCVRAWFLTGLVWFICFGLVLTE